MIPAKPGVPNQDNGDEEKRQLAIRYHSGQDLAQVEDSLRHLRFSINLLRDEEKRLLQRKAELQKILKQASGRGGP